jgi:hypothetical protein
MGLFCHQFFRCANTRQFQAALTQKLIDPTQNRRIGQMPVAVQANQL